MVRRPPVRIVTGPGGSEQPSANSISGVRRCCRRTIRLAVWALGVGGALLCPTGLRAGQAPPPTRPPLPAGAERISENIYRIGRVIVDLKARSVSCEAKVNMQRGLVEYLAVATRGKLHESVLEVDAEPLHLQLGLIMLGLEPQGGLRFQGDTRVPKGPPVDIWVSWEQGAKEVRVPAEHLVWEIDKKRTMEPGPWVFSGSMITARGFAADRERSLIATYRDPVAIINNRLTTGSDDTVYEANERVVPRPGTRVQLVIRVPEASAGR
jgi:hypothetical protein